VAPYCGPAPRKSAKFGAPGRHRLTINLSRRSLPTLLWPKLKVVRRGASNVNNDYLAVFDAVCAHGDAGREALTLLFSHERADVRIPAEAFLLSDAEDRAKRVILKEVAGKGMLAFEASQALKRWKDRYLGFGSRLAVVDHHSEQAGNDASLAWARYVSPGRSNARLVLQRCRGAVLHSRREPAVVAPNLVLR
jgi:hypothetical protein